MIKSNRCPYCDAPYTIADGGCRANCLPMRLHQALIVEYLAAGEFTENDEITAPPTQPTAARSLDR